VRFVAHDQVPAAVGRLELLLHVFIARELVEAGNHQVGFEEPVAGTRHLQPVIGENLKGEMKASIKLVLPLLSQAARADDQATLQIAASDQLLYEQPGHDGLAGAWIIGQQEAQGLPR